MPGIPMSEMTTSKVAERAASNASVALKAVTTS
jgi:hypothetical protein